jgi:3-hydroxybutyryl-CoA dehydratase
MSFSPTYLFFDDIEVGQEWVTTGRTVTQTDIVNFAGVSGDFNPIHMDHEYAKKTPFRQPIAHGLLVFSIASGLGVNCPGMRTIAFLQVREWNFREPTFINDTIHLKTKCIEKNLRGRGRRGEVVWYRGVINQDGKVVQDGIIVTLVEGRLGRTRTEALATEAVEAAQIATPVPGGVIVPETKGLSNGVPASV